MRYVGNDKVITSHQKEKDTQVETTNKATTIIALMFQEAEVMINKLARQERKSIQVTILISNVCFVD